MFSIHLMYIRAFTIQLKNSPAMSDSRTRPVRATLLSCLGSDFVWVKGCGRLHILYLHLEKLSEESYCYPDSSVKVTSEIYSFSPPD